MKMTPKNWFMLGAVGVGAWWLYKKSQNGNGASASAAPVLAPAPLLVPEGLVPSDAPPAEVAAAVAAQLTTSEAPQLPTPEGLGYAGGIYARHLFAGMT